jgi:hypothetical protein
MQITLPIIAILIVVGSLSAWRASPLYSLKSTFKLAGAFLLLVAVGVGASMAVFSGPLSHSRRRRRSWDWLRFW